MSARPLSKTYSISFALLLWALLAWTGGCSPEGRSPSGGEPASGPSQDGDGPVQVDNARLYIVPGGSSGAVYMDISHSGSSDDRLMRVEAEGVQSAQTHESVEGVDGVARMRAAPDGFLVPAGSVLELKQGGKHVMLLGLAEPLPRAGDEVELVLHFEKAGPMTLNVPVRAYGE